MSKAKDIIDTMYNNDPFSRWLGIERIEEVEGYSKLRMTVKKEMLNGFGVAHGGITYSLADSAFAFASNSRGIHAMSIDTSIAHTRAVKEGDILTAEAKEISLGRRTGVYNVMVRNQDDKIVAVFKGTVFRNGTEWNV